MNIFVNLGKNWNDTQDDITEAVRLLQQGCKRTVLMGKDDFASAFKTVCPSKEQSWLMWALVFNTERMSVWYQSCARNLLEHLAGFMHGGVWRRPSGKSWCQFLNWFCFFYVDDVFMAELSGTAEQAQHIFQIVVAILGWELDPKKTTGMSSEMEVLGCTATITVNGIKWQLRIFQK